MVISPTLDFSRAISSSRSSRSRSFRAVAAPASARSRHSLSLAIETFASRTTSSSLAQKATLQNYNAVSNVGYKFDLPSKYYIELTAGVEYVNIQFSEANVLTGTAIPLQDGHAVRGRVGAGPNGSPTISGWNQA